MDVGRTRLGPNLNLAMYKLYGGMDDRGCAETLYSKNQNGMMAS